MEKRERVYFKHFWEHILAKQMLEIEGRYFGKIPLATDLYEKLQEKFADKVVIPFADFSVTTACTLNCKYCSQWIPYLKKKIIYSLETVKIWLEDIFRYVDYIHIISPLGGEPFLNPDFAKILKLLLEYQQKGNIGFIRLVTNGTIYPDEELREVLCNEGIFVIVSQYGEMLDDRQRENYARLIEFLEENHCRYFTEKMEWIDVGIPRERRIMSDELRSYVFENCFMKDCAGIYNGALYHCSRSFALETTGVMPGGGEVIHFKEVASKKEMLERLERFYCLESLRACEYCNLPEERRCVPAAEQLMVEKLER